MTLNLGFIVEGYGDAPAVKKLAWRIKNELYSSLDLRTAEPFRVGRQKLVKPEVLERYVESVVQKLSSPRAVLILIDADTDCPAELGPELLARAKRARPDVPIGVVLAKCEFEAWFLASLESLGGQCGLAGNLSNVPEPESIRGAKEVLTRHMMGSRAYSSTVDQPALAAVFNMQRARERSDSFGKCWREVERLFRRAAGNYPT